MGRKDLYEAFDLDRSLDTAELAGLITSHPVPDDAYYRDDLRLARAILADPLRRSVYDAELATSGEGEIDPARLEEIAALGSVPSAPVEPTTHYDWGIPASPEPTSPVSTSPLSTSSEPTGPVPTNTEPAYFEPPSSEQPMVQPAPSYPLQPAPPVHPTEVVQAGPVPAASPSPQRRPFTVRFAVEPSRQRSESIMWAIGWGIVFLPWLVALLSFIGATIGGAVAGSQASSMMEEYDAIEELLELDRMVSGMQQIARLLSLIATGTFAALHTIGCVVFLQLVWTIRKIVGRNQGL